MMTWTAEELRSFLDGVKDDAWYPIYRVLAMTGCRRGEACGLRWRDVDFDAGRIAIRQTVLAVGYKVVFSTPKTKRSVRSIPVDPVTLAALRAHQRRQFSGRATELCFTDPNREPLHPDKLSAAFGAHVRRLQLRPIRLHDLRRGYATLALEAGIHPKVVSERLGHSSISVTLDTYSHAIPALEEEATARVAAMVDGGRCLQSVCNC
jgi:integrase